MRKLIHVAILMAVVLCAFFVVSCSNEDLDHIHEYTSHTIPATCTEDGKDVKICVICGEVVTVKAIPRKGHDPLPWQTKVEEACLVGKVEERPCKVCNEIVESRTTAAPGHVPGDWQTLVNGTCTENEVKVRICLVCGEAAETRREELNGHIKGEEWQIITNASCTDNLVKGKTCTKCGDVVEQFVGEKLSHDYDESTVAGTCAKGEHKLFTCKLCGHTEESDFLKPTEAHVAGAWITEKAPTCSSEGVEVQICRFCNTYLDRRGVSLDKNNHSFLVVTIPPEKDGDEGVIKYTCKNCGLEQENRYETNYLPTQIYGIIASATVRIESCDKDGRMHNLGSGFFISDNGEIVTNYHVIAGAQKIKVKRYDGVEFDVTKILAFDPSNDLVILKVESKGNSYLSIATDTLETGDSVYALGNPLGVDSVFTSGIVSNPSKKVNGIDMVVFTAPISSGSSGGPLVNARGEVVGINNQIADKGQNLNFAVMANKITAMEKTLDKTVETFYLENLDTSGVKALIYHLILNYDEKTADNKYLINKVVREETSTKNGRILRLEYDETAKTLAVSITLTEGGRALYTFEFILDGQKESYNVRMYDHLWSQYTVEGSISTTVRAKDSGGILDSSVYDKIFSYDYINYKTSGDSSLKSSDAKALFGAMYICFLDGFNSILTEADIGLTLEHFNFQLPEVVAAQ